MPVSAPRLTLTLVRSGRRGQGFAHIPPCMHSPGCLQSGLHCPACPACRAWPGPSVPGVDVRQSLAQLLADLCGGAGPPCPQCPPTLPMAPGRRAGRACTFTATFPKFLSNQLNLRRKSKKRRLLKQRALSELQLLFPAQQTPSLCRQGAASLVVLPGCRVRGSSGDLLGDLPG